MHLELDARSLQRIEEFDGVVIESEDCLDASPVTAGRAVPPEAPQPTEVGEMWTRSKAQRAMRLEYTLE
jgi:hypothetical protein